MRRENGEERGDDEDGVELVDPVLVLEERVDGVEARGEGGGGAGLAVVEEAGDEKPDKGGEDGDGGEAEFEAVARRGRLEGVRWATVAAKTGSRKCSKWLWPPKAAGMPTQPPTTERMARTTSGSEHDPGGLMDAVRRGRPGRRRARLRW